MTGLRFSHGLCVGMFLGVAVYLICAHIFGVQ